VTTPAAQARVVAARTIRAVRHGRSLDAALDDGFATLAAGLASERAVIQEMCYGTLRWFHALEPLLRGLLRKPFERKDDDLEALLLVGLYQLLHMRIAPHAAVNETVAAVALLGKDWARGLVNAVLRRVLREQPEQHVRRAHDDGRAHPAWLLERLKTAWPDDWRAIAAANNARPPMVLRINLARGTRDAYLAKLAAAGLAARAVADIDSAVLLDTPVPVERLPGFENGEASVQDAAAQLAAILLDAPAGARVLDACAAPGGKAAHLLEHTPDLTLVALDADPQRLDRVHANFARLGLTGAIVCGDAAAPRAWWDGIAFDRILLDAPCSATGVIRRHPDIRLHRTPDDIERLAAGQARLLDALWPLLAPGGKLLYVTCSILPEENHRQIARFLAREPAARAVPLRHPALAQARIDEHGGVQILPGGEHDGFYYAALARGT
jgi:16S rRNA (cytosine967-C5)-methyltransferase